MLPPGPAHGRLAGTVAFHRNPLAALRSAQAQFGDVFTLRLATTGPVVVACAPADVARLLDADPESAGAGAARRGMLPQASPLSVFGADGAEHRQARERIAPAFAAEALRGRAAEIAQIASRHVERWPDRRPFRLLPRMRLLADEVFVRELLGVREQARVQEFAHALHRMLWTPGNPPLTIPGPRDGLVGRLIDLAYRRRRAPLTALIEAEIVQRRAHGAPGPGVLGLLVRDEQRPAQLLVEELLALLMAAQEPMAAALTWTALLVGALPSVRDRLFEEGVQSDYAQAVLSESLRLHPPAIGALRRLTSAMAIGPHELAPGTTTMVPIPLVHRDPRRFDDPDRFIAERHLQRSAAHSELLAFGGGARRCLGEILARSELAAMLTALLRRNLRPLAPRSERMVLRGTILVPRRSGVVVEGS
ncbi:MAG TPA: cytochrome P450 [Solirubrobacteraceae bacterium]|jgi:cytochrome P450|nr:cytochrome P450 [Solirubrobacteraceae bacterium]